MKQSNLALILATWFGVGLIPIMPGTLGSLAALPIAWLIINLFGHGWFLVVLIAIFFLGIVVCEKCHKQLKEKDPSIIVVDEVVGQWLAVLFLPPNLIFYSFGFVLFRFFDIFKPWPISWVDRNIKNGVGVMLDDILAGAFSLSILHFTYWLLGA